MMKYERVSVYQLNLLTVLQPINRVQSLRRNRNPKIKFSMRANRLVNLVPTLSKKLSYEQIYEINSEKEESVQKEANEEPSMAEYYCVEHQTSKSIKKDTEIYHEIADNQKEDEGMGCA